MPGPSDPPPPATLRARLRALAIALALLVQCTSATPQKPLRPQDLARPEGQRALAAIEAGLALVGPRPAREAIERELIAWTRGAVRLRAAALAPFEPLLRIAGLDQRVALFTGTSRETFRLHVDGRGERGGWSTLHRAPGGDDALARRLQYRRIRGIYHPSVRDGVGPGYGGFTRWLAQELFAAHGSLDAVRVRMELLVVGEPGTEPRGVRYEHTVVHRRAQSGEGRL